MPSQLPLDMLRGLAKESADDAARVQFDKGQTDAAKATLTWLAEQAVEDAISTQSKLAKEMLQVWQGYANSVQDIITKSTKS